MVRELSSASTNTTMASMTSTNDGSSSSGKVIQEWKNPVPFLFGGLALMLALIAFALLVLACSYRRSSSSSSSNDDNAPKKAASMVERENEEPKVVVIMAGDNKPTYLAKPLPSPMISFVDPGHKSNIERI